MEKELLEATLKDVKELIKQNPNDMDLGKKVRTYFLGLPNIIEEFKNQLDDKKI
jgi:hypothetical protein